MDLTRAKNVPFQCIISGPETRFAKQFAPRYDTRVPLDGATRMYALICSYVKGRVSPTNRFINIVILATYLADSIV